MRRREPPQRPVAALKAWYRVPELARMAGVHRNEMRRKLVALGVPIDDSGGTGTVLLTDLRAIAPGLWDSIVLRCEAVAEAAVVTGGDDATAA